VVQSIVIIIQVIFNKALWGVCYCEVNGGDACRVAQGPENRGASREAGVESMFLKEANYLFCIFNCYMSDGIITLC
jgi:hypothetical protein